MKRLRLTPEEATDIAVALQFRANYIETGNIILSAQDAEQTGKPVRALDRNQMKKVIQLRDLADRVLVSEG